MSLFSVFFIDVLEILGSYTDFLNGHNNKIKSQVSNSPVVLPCLFFNWVIALVPGKCFRREIGVVVLLFDMISLLANLRDNI